LGDVALAGRQLRDHHDDPQRAVCGAAQPDARRAEAETWPEWLGEEPTQPPSLKALLAPYPAEEIVAWPVSPRVGNVKNNDPSLVEPVVLAA